MTSEYDRNEGKLNDYGLVAARLLPYDPEAKRKLNKKFNDCYAHVADGSVYLSLTSNTRKRSI